MPSIQIRVEPTVIVDIQMQNDDLGIALSEREVSIGSSSRDVDDRFELVDFDSKEVLAEQALKIFLPLLRSGATRS